MRFFLLGRARRQKVRDIARAAWLECGRSSHALAVAEKDVRRQLAGSFWASLLIGIAVQLAIRLIRYWWENRVDSPALTFQPGEPGTTKG